MLKLNLTKDEAEKIAFIWIKLQETNLDLYGGYKGNLFVVRDMLVWFINSYGEKYDGAKVEILTKERVLERIRDYEDFIYEFEEVENDESWRNYKSYFGDDVQSLAEYLLTADGRPDT